MSNPLPVSIVVPVYNMDKHVELLWKTLKEHNIVSLVREILFVNDGSTDGTQAFLETIKSEASVVTHSQNLGRFKARLTGAQNAVSENLLFIDARNRIPADFADQLQMICSTYSSAIGEVLIDEKESVYSLYWQRSHEFIFHQHYAHLRRGPIQLTPENYDNFLKGTTLFYCRRSLFLDVCLPLEKLNLQSDDTYLLKEYVKKEPIIIDQRFNTWWSPRQDFAGFMARVRERGPSFVEYHIFTHRGKFFAVTMFLIAYFFVMMSFLFVSVSFFTAFFLFSLTLIGATASLFSKSPLEWIRLAPVHTATVVTFFLSVLTAVCKRLLNIKD